MLELLERFREDWPRAGQSEGTLLRPNVPHRRNKDE